MKTIDTDKLFVACYVYDDETILELWEQYESFGKVQHDIYVNPKHVLLVEEEIDGQKVYIDYKTRKVVKPVDCSCSRVSTGSCTQNLFLSAWPLGPLYDEGVSYFEQKKRTVSFLIPFSQFYEERFGVPYDYRTTSFAKAKTILRMINMGEGKMFLLSDDPEVAQSQIDERIHHRIPDKVKVKVKK